MKRHLALLLLLSACSGAGLSPIRESKGTHVPNMDFAPASEVSQKALAELSAPAAGQLDIKVLPVEGKQQILILSRANGQPAEQVEKLLLRLCVSAAQGNIESSESLSFSDQDTGRAVVCNSSIPAEQVLPRMTPFG